MKTIKKTYEIEASPDVIARFERFLALLHYNSRFGHSAYFGMPLDGDGSDTFTVDVDLSKYINEVDLIGGVGYNFEIALDNTYSCKKVSNPTHYYKTQNNKLYRDNIVIKEIKSE